MEWSSRRLYTKTPPNRGLIRPRGPVKSGKPSVNAILRPCPERAGDHQPWLKAALDVRHHHRERVGFIALQREYLYFRNVPSSAVVC